MSDYSEFLARKRMVDPATGLKVVPPLHPAMFEFQRDITGWALRRGRAALFAGTGLGKSLMELAWADAIHKETGKDILHLAPLAVSAQLAREANKFGIAAQVVPFQSRVQPGINITNYQKIEHFDLSRFGGVILDESSILKSVDGHYRTKLIEACATIPYRLAATATPAPNDFMELGNHAEFLGVMSYTDMLATFFTHDGGDTQKWRLKGHAENEFWKWMASWAVMIRKPSDLGYSNEGYDLPPLMQQQHLVAADYAPSLDTGLLFPMEANSLQERLAARRDTIDERVGMAVGVVISSYWSKLSAWHGNQNTKLTAAQKLSAIRSMQRSSRPLAAEPPKKIESTWLHTTEPTNQSTSEPESSKTKSMSDGASDMPATPSLLNNAETLPPLAPLQSGEKDGLERNTASEPSNTMDFSGSKMGSAQSAKGNRKSETVKGSPSIMTTIPAVSADSSAQTATEVSASFKTNETFSPEQSNISTRPKLDPWVIWCHLNKEQDALKAAFGDMAISIHGGHDEDEKERLHEDWLNGKAPILIVKPSMFGHGLNWQHCSNMVFVGLNDSFEQVFQAIRRCWRFGQTKPVNVHFIAAETEGAVVANLRRKEADADRMAASMVLHTMELSRAEIRGQVRDTPSYNPEMPLQLPTWLEAS